MSDGVKAVSVAIGLRVKTGRATAILLAGPVDAPTVSGRRAIQLWDPAIPESHQPYHAELELPPEKSAAVVKRAIAAVESLALTAMKDLATEVRRSGQNLRGVGLVVGSDTDPRRIGNPHVRAHALEGKLFRDVLETAARELTLPCVVVVEREAFDKAAAALGRKPAALKRIVSDYRRSAGAPWGGEEKTATVAAWMALAR